MSLTFDAATHTYRYAGKVVPGVTSILRPLTGLDAVPTDVLKRAQAFGTAVHYGCELQDRGTLATHTVDPALWPYLDAWRRFCKEHNAEWSFIEQPVYNEQHGYAGTPDRLGTVDGKQAVVDIKSGAVMPVAGMQIAAYKNAIKGVSPLCRRIAVQLKADGSYEMHEFTDRNDWPTFLSLLTLRLWCAKHNVVPNFQGESNG